MSNLNTTNVFSKTIANAIEIAIEDPKDQEILKLKIVLAGAISALQDENFTNFSTHILQSIKDIGLDPKTISLEYILETYFST
jgi:hypothetical protein